MEHQYFKQTQRLCQLLIFKFSGLYDSFDGNSYALGFTLHLDEVDESLQIVCLTWIRTGFHIPCHQDGLRKLLLDYRHGCCHLASKRVLVSEASQMPVQIVSHRLDTYMIKDPLEEYTQFFEVRFHFVQLELFPDHEAQSRLLRFQLVHKHISPDSLLMRNSPGKQKRCLFVSTHFIEIL
ncbi:hypothetical protein T01_13139 [Trichinella spiralis]|uniref:Uncharacterized protein n=1 Tax=Trichinella spiralis TaxID=6334 RepID=A0A0V1AWA1_TRISP|nr:hypothetical protein T01_13139 [Trichinella spiralis]